MLWATRTPASERGSVSRPAEGILGYGTRAARRLRRARRRGAPVRGIRIAAGVGAFPPAHRRESDQRRQAHARLAAAPGSAQFAATRRRCVVSLAIRGAHAQSARALSAGAHDPGVLTAGAQRSATRRQTMGKSAEIGRASG